MNPSQHMPVRLPWLPLWQLVLARLREFCREPAAIFWVYVFPILTMLTLGIAFRNKPVEQITVLVQEGPQAQVLLAALTNDAEGRFRARIVDDETARRQLRIGKSDLVISAPSSEEPAYHYYFDPTKPGGVLARNAADDVLQRAAGRKDLVVTHVHEVSEPGGRYIDFLVPGLLGVGIMGGGLWGVGFAIVDMRIRKLLKRFLATPMRRSHFLAAVMISRLLFTIPEIVFLLVCAHWFFGVVNHGSYVAVGLVILMGTIEFAGIGLLVASRAKTLETVSGLMNLVMLPMWMASGIFFSYERFPEEVQPFIRYLPLTPLIDALRAIMLEGATLASLWLPLLIITIYGMASFVLALRWFRWN
jgi:ABC-type multidrug transport system permease subunit